MTFGDVMGRAVAVIFGKTGEPALFQRASGGDAIPTNVTLDEPGANAIPGYTNFQTREQRLQMEFPRAGIDTVVADDQVTFTADASPQFRLRRFLIDSLANVDADVLTVNVREVPA